MKGLKIQGSLTTMLEINNWRCVIYNPLFGSCTCIRWLYNLALMLGHIICQDFGLCCQTHNLVVVGIWVTSAIDRYMEQQLSPTILQNNWEMFRINYLLRVTGPQLTLRKSNVQLTRNIFQLFWRIIGDIYYFIYLSVVSVTQISTITKLWV